MDNLLYLEDYKNYFDELDLCIDPDKEEAEKFLRLLDSKSILSRFKHSMTTRKENLLA